VIRKFRHKGLQRLYADDESRGVSADMLRKIRRILARLEVARNPEAMNLPGWFLHPLKGQYNGFWAVSVSGNWRIVFRFQGADVTDVDLVDYH